MELVLPQFGLFFWTLVIFLSFFFILKKFAWGPILSAIQEREQSIENSLKAAESARSEMAKLTAQNENLLKEARAERDKIVKEALAAKEQILAEAKAAATEEKSKLLADAKKEIEQERNKALAEIKAQVSELSLSIAEKVLRKQMENKTEQEGYVKRLVTDLKLN